MKTDKINKLMVLAFLLVSLTFSTSATDLQNIESITPSGTQNIYVNGTLDMHGDPITDTNGQLQLEGGNIQIPSGNLLISGTTDTVDLDNPGNAITINGNQYAVATDSISTDELDMGTLNTKYVERNGDTMTGNLNLRGNSLKATNELEIQEDTIKTNSLGLDRIITKETWPNGNDNLNGDLGAWSLQNTDTTGGSYGNPPYGNKIDWSNDGTLTSPGINLKDYSLFSEGDSAGDTQTFSSTRVFGTAYIYTDSSDNGGELMEIRINGSGNWETVYQHDSNEDSGNDAGWQKATFDITPYINENGPTAIRFNHQGPGGGDHAGVGRIYIHEGSTPTNLGGIRFNKDQADTKLGFYDQNSNTFRNIVWDNSANEWKLEDSSGTLRDITTENQDSTGTDSQDLSSTADVSGTNDRVEITGGSNTVIDDDFEANTDAATRCGSDQVLEGSDTCVTNYEAGDDGDTNSNNEIQDLSQVLNQGSTANQQIDMNGNAVAFGAASNADPPAAAVKDTGYVALANQEDQYMPSNSQFTLFADHSEGLQYNDQNHNDYIIASRSWVNSNDENTQNSVNKDLVAGPGLSGGSNNVLPGSDGDITVNLNANDLDNDGDISSFDNADDLDSNGNIGLIDSDDDSQMAFDIDSSAVEMRVHDNSGEFRLVPYNTSNNNWLWSSRLDYDAGLDRWRIRSNLNMDNANINNIGGLQNCGADEFVNGNGNCEPDTDTNDGTGTDDQNLGYSNDNAPTGSYATHTVTIESGSNTGIRDYYDPNTDSQDLSTTADVSGTNDRIEIAGGSNTVIDDDFAADDQNLGTSGNQITLDNGGSITAPYANNADQLDGNQLSSVRSHSGDTISDNTVDSSEIQNSDRFTFNGVNTNSEVRTFGNSIDLDSNDQGIYMHDGTGNFNIKSGIADGSDTITAGSGGSEIQMNENGRIELKVDDTTSAGNTFTKESGITIDESTVSINGNFNGCGSDQFVNGNGNCVADSTGSDSQNLGYSNDNTPTGSYATHTVTISGGSNTGIRDYYDPNTDSQNLGDVLNQNNVANQKIDMNGYELDFNTNELGVALSNTDTDGDGTSNGLGLLGGNGEDVQVGTGAQNNDFKVFGNMYADNHGFGGTPSIAVAVGDTDTGLNSDTDGRLEFWTNGAERMSLTNSLLTVSDSAQIANRLKVNGVAGTASSDGSQGIGAPTVYTNMVEAPTEKGGGSTYLELGNGGFHGNVNSDEIGLVTQGTVQARVNSNGDFDTMGNNITDTTKGNVTIAQDLKVYGDIWQPESVGSGSGGSGGDQNLSQVLNVGNKAGANIDLNGFKISDTADQNVTIKNELQVEGGKVWVDNADLAEKYGSKQKLEEGEIVKIDSNRDDSIIKTKKEYESSVGVVSTKPGYILDSDRKGYPIALEGKVPIKISEMNGEINRGDRIVASNKPGIGMKCGIKSLNQAQNFKKYREIAESNRKCRDSTIGKALENSEGKSKILVKLSG